MSQFDTYNAGKADILSRYDRLENALNQLSGVVDVSADLTKIGDARRMILGDELRIALLGAFSDGKTSVAAGWLGKVMPDMKIDADESSDALAEYKIEGLSQPVSIIDTPGLFGDKVLEDDRRYDDVTRQFIAEAHVVLYVVDATNPVKESHAAELRRVMRGLGKLDSTIFVINKMDEVSDLRDTTDFEEQARIKRENVAGKLIRHLELTADEVAQLRIVAIAANPAGRGFGYWEAQPRLYELRSRIDDLRQAADAVLTNSSRDVLLRKTGASVLQDLINRRLVEANAVITASEGTEKALGEEISRIGKDIAQGQRAVRQSVDTLREELFAMESRMLTELRGLPRESLNSFIEENLGMTTDAIGFKLRSRIDRAIQRCADQSVNILEGVQAKISHTLESTSAVLDTLAASAFSSSTAAIGALGKIAPEAIKAGIFAARDVLGSTIGLTIKFKPWEAAKFAGNIARFAGPVSAGLQLIGDAVSAYRSHNAEQELAELKGEIADMIKLHFQTVYTFIDAEDKATEAFAPQLAQFKASLALQVEQLDASLARRQAIEAGREALASLSYKPLTVAAAVPAEPA